MRPTGEDENILSFEQEKAKLRSDYHGLPLGDDSDDFIAELLSQCDEGSFEDWDFESLMENNPVSSEDYTWMSASELWQSAREKLEKLAQLRARTNYFLNELVDEKPLNN